MTTTDMAANATDTGRRLFLACWPEQSLQETLYSLARRLQRKYGGRKIARQNIHLTLLFLGQVYQQKEQQLRDRLRLLDAKEFELGALRLISNQLGFDAADKPFRPHVTLLRKSHAAALQEIKPLSWKVDSYYLIESVQTGAGVEYRIVEEFALADEQKESQF